MDYTNSKEALIDAGICAIKDMHSDETLDKEVVKELTIKVLTLKFSE